MKSMKLRLQFFLLFLFFIPINSMDIDNQQRLNKKLIDTMQGMQSHPTLLVQYIAPLIAQGADINTQDQNGNTPLMLIIYPNNAAILNFLLAHGANPDIKNKKGINALIAAAWNTYNENLSTLLAANADPDIQDNEGNTALILSLFSQKPPTKIKTAVQLLLSSGANPNIQDNTGNTALHFAVQKGYHDIISILLQSGAKSSIVNKNKQSALTIAYEQLTNAQNEDERKKYTPIIAMLEHPEKIERTGLEKL